MIQVAMDHPFWTYILVGLIAAGIFRETQRWLLPLRIPSADITRLADGLIARHGLKAAEMAIVEQDRAMLLSDPYEQGRWWRVEREIRRRAQQV